jgi:hypothetical protein
VARREIRVIVSADSQHASNRLSFACDKLRLERGR